MKVINFIKKYKWPIVFFLIILVVVIFFLLRRGEESNIPMPTPTPIAFSLLEIFPLPGEQELALPETAISLLFSKPINISTAVIKISPLIDYQLSTADDGKILLISPSEPWKYGINYKLSVNVLSKEEGFLSSPVEFNYKFKQITSSPFEEKNIR